MIEYETGFKNLQVLCFTYNSHNMFMREAGKALSSCFKSLVKYVRVNELLKNTFNYIIVLVWI